MKKANAQSEKLLRRKVRKFAAKSGVPSQSEIEVVLTVKSPPRIVKTIRDLIYWEYAKLMACAAGLRDNYGFIVNRYKKLKSGEIKWKDADEDAKELLLKERKCIYCGSQKNLTFDHLIPRSRGGPDISANTVLACQTCNSAKKDKDVFEWYYIDKKSKFIPRHIWKRYLKLVWDFHVLHRTLDSVDLNKDGKLNLLDLSAVFNR